MVRHAGFWVGSDHLMEFVGDSHTISRVPSGWSRTEAAKTPFEPRQHGCPSETTPSFPLLEPVSNKKILGPTGEKC